MCDLKWYLFCSTEYYQAAGQREGAIGRSESEPGSLGQMDGSGEEYSASGGYGNSFEDEPPLLQELGIDFELIKQKVRARQKGEGVCEHLCFSRTDIVSAESIPAVGCEVIQ